MSRHPLQHDLPPLATPAGDVPGFEPGVNRTASVAAHLRTLAGRLRGTKHVTFYPAREVAAAFGLSLSVVSRIYNRLETEGLLLRLRGSKTLLTPRKLRPRVALRGVVGVPLWVYGFRAMAEWRLFALHMDEQLRRHQFVSDFVFHRSEADLRNYAANLTDRLIAHHLDQVVWFKPHPGLRPVLDALADGGIEVITVGETHGLMPAVNYRLSWGGGLRKVWRQWRADGVSRVIIATGQRAPGNAFDWLVDSLERAGLAATRVAPTIDDCAAYVETLLRSRLPIVFPDNLSVSFICLVDPAALRRLLAARRLLLLHRLEMAPETCGDARLDIVCHDWAGICARIADDIAARRVPIVSTPAMLEAPAHLQVPARDFSTNE